jgi:Leucine-rich repeat (LRR) protein
VLSISLLVCCLQTRKRNNYSIDDTTAEALENTVQSADPRLVLGGCTTEYTSSKADSISSYYVFIEPGKHSDLTGIEQLRNLEWLSISIWETGEIDFSPLRSLSKLNHLYIGGAYVNQVPDLSGISSLTDLKIQFANLTTMDGIEKIPNLEILIVENNLQPITDTSALRQVKNLKYLDYFDKTYAVKMSDLTGLTALEQLGIAVYREHDLTGIGALRLLKTLYVVGRISEWANGENPYEAIGELAGLTELYLNAPLPSVDFLANNVNLEKLTLVAGSEREDFFDKVLVVDLAPLANLKKLKYLRIQGFDGCLDTDELPELEYFNDRLFEYH